MARYIYALDMELLQELKKKNKSFSTGFSHAGKQFKVDVNRPQDFALETDTAIVDPHIHHLILIKDSGKPVAKEDAKEAAEKAVLKDTAKNDDKG